MDSIQKLENCVIMTSVCHDNCTNMESFYEMMTDEMWTSWDTVADYFDYQPWVFSIIGSALVGLSGIFPLFIISIDEGANLKHGAGAGTLKILLSFAVGGLLGDVFLHLLPEAWGNKALNIESARGHPSMVCGLWVLGGFLLFIIAEKIFIGEEANDDDDACDVATTAELNSEISHNNNHGQVIENNNLLSVSKKIAESEKFSMNLGSNYTRKNGYIINSISANLTNGLIKSTNGSTDLYTNGEMQRRLFSNSTQSNGYNKDSINKNTLKESFKGINEDSDALLLNGQLIEKRTKEMKVKSKHISGYLNLLANCIDNFTHGLAVGGSFLVSFRLGALTTFAILIHEIPHEVGDFAILLKSGFSRWDAARAQLMTATGGIFGALIAVLCSGSGVESRTSWILPFTAGGFLHIGLVTILPELLKESNPKESMKQLGALLSGIIVMALLTIICD